MVYKFDYLEDFNLTGFRYKQNVCRSFRCFCLFLIYDFKQNMYIPVYMLHLYMYKYLDLCVCIYTFIRDIYNN